MPELTPEERERKIREELLREIANSALGNFYEKEDVIKNYISKLDKENIIVKGSYKPSEYYQEKIINFRIKQGSVPHMIVGRLLAEAIENGLHKDPKELEKFIILSTIKIWHELYSKIPGIHKIPLYEDKTGIADPLDWIAAMQRALRLVGQEESAKFLNKMTSYIDDLAKKQGKRWEEFIRENPEILFVAVKEVAQQYGKKELAEEAMKIRKIHVYEMLGEHPPQILTKTEEAAEKERMKYLIEEDLPSAAYRLAIISKMLEGGLLPEEIAQDYLYLLHSEYTPQGRGLYNLIYKMLAEYERDIAEGKPIKPVSQKLEEVIEKALQRTTSKPAKPARKVLEDASQKIHPAWIEAKVDIGIPIPSTKAAKAVKTLIEKMEKIEKGELDPFEEDTKQEILALVKALEKHIDPKLEESDKKEKELSIFKNYLNTRVWHKSFYEPLILYYYKEASQTEADNLKNALEDAPYFVYDVIKKNWYSHVKEGTPLYKLITDATKYVYEKLKEKYDRYTARKVANIVQHTLVLYPLAIGLHAKVPGEALKIYKNGLEEENETALLLLGLHALNERLKSTDDKQLLLEKLLENKQRLSAVESLKGAVHRNILAYQEARKTSGISKDKLLTAMAKGAWETIKSISGVRKIEKG